MLEKLEELLESYKEEVKQLNAKQSRIQKNILGDVSEECGASNTTYETFKYRMDKLIEQRENALGSIKSLTILKRISI